VNRVRRRVATLAVFVLGKDPELNRTLTRIRCFLVNEDGPTSVEYAVLAALVVVCIAGVRSIGMITSGSFNSALSSLSGS
jgi:pilus assembly protein Flp/PilA